MFQTTSIGLDVHAKSIHAAILDTTTGEVIKQKLPDALDPTVIDFIHTHCPDPESVQVIYESGPTGFHLARALHTSNIACDIVATSKLIRPAGDRVKTDKRDAEFLARIAAMGEYVAVRIPTIEEESARDLARTRDDTRRELTSARHRLSKLALRHGYVYPGKTTWTRSHDKWLRDLRANELTALGTGTCAAFDDYYDNVCHTLARCHQLDEQITTMAATPPFANTVNRLACLRGISTLSGFGLAVEINDWARFTPTTIGSFVGLVPSEYSSGTSRSQGGITRTGNTHARRLLVEASWQHASVYRPGAALRAQWAKAPRAVAAHADKGNRRLHQRWVGLKARKKDGTTITAAIARELAGWCQVVATMSA